MIFYSLRKLGTALLTLLAVTLCTFLIIRFIPGGPFDSEREQPAHIRKMQEEKYGFNNPPLVHYFIYLKGLVLRGDLGVSIRFTDRRVVDIIAETLPVSLTVGALSLLLALLIGVPTGILSALKPRSMWDASAMFIAVSGVTLPTFLVGALLVLVFCYFLGLLPPARLDSWESYILPVVTLGTRPAGIIARLVRASLLDEMKMDYVRTARAKGLAEKTILVRHALRNSLLPMITVLGPITASILTGSFITEHFFAISGMAKHFINAVNDRDVFLMLGVTLVFATLLIVINLIVDLIYPILDPRIRAR